MTSSDIATSQFLLSRLKTLRMTSKCCRSFIISSYISIPWHNHQNELPEKTKSRTAAGAAASSNRLQGAESRPSFLSVAIGHDKGRWLCQLESNQ
jgi:hypothetical protein